MTANNGYEKVSFNLPSDIKSEVLKLKESMHVSLNTIYKTAIAEYVQRQEVKRWEDAAKLASKDKEYQKLCKELSDTEEDTVIQIHKTILKTLNPQYNLV